MADDRRGGYFAVPRDLWREARRALSPSHRLVLVALLAEANYTPGEIVTADGHRVALEVGELLVGSRTFALRNGLDRGVVRRALERLRAQRWITVRPALESGPPPGPPPALRAAQGDGPPPTIVRLNVYREIVWPSPDSGPPPRPAVRPTPRTQTGPIQQGSIQQGQEEACGAIAPPPSRADDVAPPPARPSASRRRGDLRHAPLVGRLTAVFGELRGTPYGFAPGKDAKAVTQLLSLGTDDEIERRWRLALGLGARWPGCASLAVLASRWNELATAPPRLGPDGRPLKRYPKVQVHTEWS